MRGQAGGVDEAVDAGFLVAEGGEDGGFLGREFGDGVVFGEGQGRLAGEGEFAGLYVRTTVRLMKS